MTAKELLLEHTHQAFSGDPEMSLKAALTGVTQAEASWRLNAETNPVEKIVHHLAACKIMYLRQGFGKWKGPDESERAVGIEATIALLDQAQEHLMDCLRACSAEDLAKPVPIQFHGESAAHFFWVMLMHDLCHGGQIQIIRRAYEQSTGT